MAGKKKNGAGAPNDAWKKAAEEANAKPGEQVKLPAPVDVEVRYEEVEVPDPLTDEEADLLAMQAMRDLAKADRLKAELRRISEPLTSDIKKAQKDASKAAKEADEKCRVIKMRCRVERDYRVLTVRTIREDTGGKALPDRPMTPAEIEDRTTDAPKEKKPKASAAERTLPLPVVAAPPDPDEGDDYTEAGSEVPS